VNLHRMLLERKAAGKPVTIGLIGAGKFGTMFLSQVRVTDGMHVVAIADLNVKRAHSQLETACWPKEQYQATSMDDALKHGSTFITDNADLLVDHPAVEVIIEATGDPRNGIKYALKSIAHHKHIIMVNVEADVVAGPLLARKARKPVWSIRSLGAISPP